MTHTFSLPVLSQIIADTRRRVSQYDDILPAGSTPAAVDVAIAEAIVERLREEFKAWAKEQS